MKDGKISIDIMGLVRATEELLATDKRVVAVKAENTVTTHKDYIQSEIRLGTQRKPYPEMSDNPKEDADE